MTAAPAALNLAIGDRVLYAGTKNVMLGKRGTVIGTCIASNGVPNVDVRWDGSPYPASRRILRDAVKQIPKTTCFPSINGQFVCINPESSLCGTRGVVVDILQNGNIHARMTSGPMFRETIVLRPEAIEMIAPWDSRYKKSEA